VSWLRTSGWIQAELDGLTVLCQILRFRNHNVTAGRDHRLRSRLVPPHLDVPDHRTTVAEALEAGTLVRRLTVTREHMIPAGPPSVTFATNLLRDVGTITVRPDPRRLAIFEGEKSTDLETGRQSDMTGGNDDVRGLRMPGIGDTEAQRVAGMTAIRTCHFLGAPRVMFQTCKS
jgi:hypothetical protein